MGAQAVRLSNVDIDNALANRDFEVLFQPIFDLGNGALARMETFVRWRHPSLGVLPPGAFISFFESQGRMGELSRYVLGQALENYINWRGTYAPGFSINLALTDLADETFPDFVSNLLTTHDFPADAVTFECPMPPVDHDLAEIKDQLSSLHATGVRLAIEVRGRANDFLRSLDPFPFDEIKTGGAAILRFARTVRGPGLSAISEILDIANEAGASITAVGVEDQASLSALRGLGFSAAQGNHLGKVGGLNDFRPAQINQVRSLLDLEDLSTEDLGDLFRTVPALSADTPHKDQIEAAVPTIDEGNEKTVPQEGTVSKSTNIAADAVSTNEPSETPEEPTSLKAKPETTREIARETTVERARRKAALLARKKGKDALRAELAARRAKLGLSEPSKTLEEPVSAARNLQEQLTTAFKADTDETGSMQVDETVNSTAIETISGHDEMAAPTTPQTPELSPEAVEKNSSQSSSLSEQIDEDAQTDLLATSDDKEDFEKETLPEGLTEQPTGDDVEASNNGIIPTDIDHDDCDAAVSDTAESDSTTHDTELVFIPSSLASKSMSLLTPSAELDDALSKTSPDHVALDTAQEAEPEEGLGATEELAKHDTDHEHAQDDAIDDEALPSLLASTLSASDQIETPQYDTQVEIPSLTVEDAGAYFVDTIHVYSKIGMGNAVHSTDRPTDISGFVEAHLDTPPPTGAENLVLFSLDEPPQKKPQPPKAVKDNLGDAPSDDAISLSDWVAPKQANINPAKPSPSREGSHTNVEPVSDMPSSLSNLSLRPDVPTGSLAIDDEGISDVDTLGDLDKADQDIDPQTDHLASESEATPETGPETDSDLDTQAETFTSIALGVQQDAPSAVSATTDVDTLEAAHLAESLTIAKELRQQRQQRKNFLMRKYQIVPTHFWPRSWTKRWARKAADRDFVRRAKAAGARLSAGGDVGSIDKDDGDRLF